MSIKQDIDKFLEHLGKNEKVDVEHATPLEDGKGVFSLSEAWFQDLYKYTKKRVLSEHMKCHELFNKAAPNSKLFEYAKKTHVEIIRAMRKRGLKHYIKNEFDTECESCINSDDGDRVYLKEIINKFKSFTLKNIKVWLVGDAPTKGHTDKGIHMLIESENKKPEVEKKVLSMFPQHLRSRIKFLYVPEGPSGGCIPLYVVKYQMPNTDILNSLSSVEHFNFIRPLKAVKEKNMSAVSEIKECNVNYPVEISLGIVGDRLQVHKKDNIVKVFDDAGQDITNKDYIAKFNKIHGSFIMDIFKTENEYILFDILQHNTTSLYDKSLDIRRNFMEKLELPTGITLNRVVFASDREILEKGIEANFANAEGLLLRPLNDKYDLNGVSNSWIKFILEDGHND